MVTVVNVHSIVLAQNDFVLAAAHHKAVLKTPDGVPLVWIGRLIGRKNVERVYGPDLMMETLKRSEEKGYTNYFFGGKKGVPELLSEKIKNKYPNIKIAGFYSPPFRSMNENEEKNFKSELERLRPDIMWVGLGCPKQEKWMAANIGNLETKIMIGVGAAFDFHAGLLKQAPLLIQKCGLEWLFRMCVEPKRLWRRYLIYNTLFMWKILKKILNGQLGA